MKNLFTFFIKSLLVVVPIAAFSFSAFAEGGLEGIEVGVQSTAKT
jgi:hypothetical protein